MSKADQAARLLQLRMSDQEREKLRCEAEQRARIVRAGIKAGFVSASHPKYPTIIVKHVSKFGAILTAAEAWGCDWVEVKDDIKMTAVDKPGNRERPLRVERQTRRRGRNRENGNLTIQHFNYTISS